MIGYARAHLLVALTDARPGWARGWRWVPLALPLASLVVFSVPLHSRSELPWSPGFLAVVVACWPRRGYALITVGLLIAVRPNEAHLLQPAGDGSGGVDSAAVVRPLPPAVLAGRRRPLAVPTVAFFNNAVQVLLGGNPLADVADVSSDHLGV